MTSLIWITLATEGSTDTAAGDRLISYCGGRRSQVYGERGKAHLLNSLAGYDAGAAYSPWLVLIDLDHDFECPAEAAETWMPEPSSGMCFCIVARELEAWLLADRVRFAQFIGCSVNRIPTSPEDIDDPKQVVVDLARARGRPNVREGLVPTSTGNRTVGPLYSAMLSAFIRDRWTPETAAESAPTLARAIERVRDMVSAGAEG